MFPAGVHAFWGGITLHGIATTFGALCAACAIFGIVYTLFATFALRRFFAQGVAASRQGPPVTVVKPLHGDERGLLDNLTSFIEQDYAGAVQYVFGVHSADDAALAVVSQLRRLHPQADIHVVVDARLHGPNRKISNIINMMTVAKHDTLIFADSDVRVGRGYLSQIVGELQMPGIGLVTCVYQGAPEPNVWSNLSAAATNYHFLPNVVCGMATGLASPCFGQSIAMRRETLMAIGGFERFASHLAEDYAIGAAVRELGLEVAVPAFVVSHACPESSAKKLIAHEFRWSRTIRTIDRWGHLGSVLTHPLALSLLATLLLGGAFGSWILILAAIVARLSIKLEADRILGSRVGHAWFLPFGDVILFLIFVAGFFSNNVTWRGSRFRVSSDGLISAAAD